MNTPGSLSYKHAVTNENLDSPFNTEETNPYYDEEEADEGEDKLRYVLIKSPRRSKTNSPNYMDAKRERRLLPNKESAKHSRRRKQEHLKELETHIGLYFS
nr:light-inducible protein CPRF2-like [Ipomoea batatas]